MVSFCHNALLGLNNEERGGLRPRGPLCLFGDGHTVLRLVASQWQGERCPRLHGLWPILPNILPRWHIVLKPISSDGEVEGASSPSSLVASIVEVEGVKRDLQ